MKKTKRTPVPRAKPNHVGTVGRKMNCLTQDWDLAQNGIVFTPPTFKGFHPRTDVLVISLSPANVERIREEVCKAIFETTPLFFSGEPLSGNVKKIFMMKASAVLAALGLTPAKRKGRK